MGASSGTPRLPCRGRGSTRPCLRAMHFGIWKCQNIVQISFHFLQHGNKLINWDDCLSTQPGSNSTAKGAIARARDRLPLVDFSWRSGCLNMRKSGFFKDGEKQQKSVSARFGCFLSPSIWVGGGVFGELSYGGSPIRTYRSSANSHPSKELAGPAC